jgi:hypothetical protein
VKALASLAKQLREHLSVLVADDQRGRLVEQIDAIESESKVATLDPGKLRHALTAIQGMIRSAMIGAGSSIIAQGALAPIGETLKHL